MINTVPLQTSELVKHFEGLYLEAYRCPAGVLTISWGITGAFVKPGMRITEQQAETYLQEALISVANSIPDDIWERLQEHQRASLISFLYNVGNGALDAPSFGRAIRQNLSEVPTRLLDWDKAVVDGVKRPLLGLTRRRRAEAILWAKNIVITDNVVLDDWGKVQNFLGSQVAIPTNSINLINAAKYYKGEPHQLKAFEWLDTQLNDSQRQNFAQLYRALPSAKVLSTLPTNSQPNPYMVFDMPLGDKPLTNIVVGILTLKGFPNANSATEWNCTSGQPRYQYSGGTDQKGKGPLPGHKYVKDGSGKTLKHYWVTTSPTSLPNTKGINGNAYHITPDPVVINGIHRGEFMIHRDSNRLYSPGSAGCIVSITDEIFRSIEDMMTKLRSAGFSKVPLEVNH